MMNSNEFLNKMKKGQRWMYNVSHVSINFLITNITKYNVFVLIEDYSGITGLDSGSKYISIGDTDTWDIGGIQTNNMGRWTLLYDLSSEDIMSGRVKSKNNKFGVTCCTCGMYNEWAEPNQKDGSYICYNCRY